MTDESEQQIDRSEVEYVEPQHWRYKGTQYLLGHTATGTCSECGYYVPEEKACYLRDGPLADDWFDHVCWDCGQEVTGFGE